MSSSSGLATHAHALNDQLDKLVASFNTPSTQGKNGFEEDFGIVASPFAASDLQPGVPASAIENNFQGARAGLTNAGPSLGTQLQTQTTAVTSPASSASGSLSKLSSASGSASATTNATTTSTTSIEIGTISTQVFSNAYTQASSPLNAAIGSVDASLQQAFGLLQTQVSNDVTSVISAFGNAPARTFQPTVSFATGTGVTFSST
jgi:hypothetical protein